MAEPTKADLQEQIDKLQADNENLRGQLAASGARGPVAPVHTFMLTEGNRQDLEMRGVTSIGGVLMTREQVLAEVERAGTQRGVEIAEPPPGADLSAIPTVEARRAAVYGVDFVYPSVAPGKIDPAVAGTPGINGPAAAEVAPARTDVVPAADLTGDEQ